MNVSNTTHTLSSITWIVTLFSFTDRSESSILCAMFGAIFHGVEEFTHNGTKITAPYLSLKWSNNFAAPVSTALVTIGVNSVIIID